MKKSELKTLNYLEFKNGDRRIVMLNTSEGDISVANSTMDIHDFHRLYDHFSLDCFNNDLIDVSESKLLGDVVKVYGRYGNLLWERPGEFENGEWVYWSGNCPTIGKIVRKRGNCYILEETYNGEVYDSCHESNIRVATRSEVDKHLKLKPREVTIEEIQKELGYKIKIVE
jgi:hypothetical protein